MKNEENIVKEHLEKDVEETGKKVETETTENTGSNENLITPEKAQEMVDKALARKLPPKEKMEAFEKWEEEQKSLEEKREETLTRLKEIEAEKESIKKENIILKNQVKTEDIDYVMFKVSKQEGEFEENLKEFLKDNPKFLQTSDRVTTGVKVKNANTTKEDNVISILKQKHPDIDF